MTTPSYLGTGQSTTSSGGGLLGRLGSYFGGGPPIYAGSGQTLPAATGSLLGAQAPIYLAPAPKPKVETFAVQTSSAASFEMPCDAAPIVSPCEPTLMECPIDPEALAAGHIAIIVPRQGLITTKQQ